MLVEQGVDGLALRAVAREMGMTAPALYRYFASREDLVENVVADLYDELTDVLETARDAADPATPGVQLLAVQPRLPALGDHPPRRVRAAVRQRRRAASSRPRTARARASSPPQVAGRRFGGVFAELVARIYLEQGFPVPADDDLEPALQEQLRAWCAKLPVAAAARRHARSSCPAGSGSTAWSAWRSSGTCGSPWTTPSRCSRRSCTASASVLGVADAVPRRRPDQADAVRDEAHC